MVDDVLDYEEGEGTLGKPGGADLKLGLATAPALYAWEEHEAMGPLIKRKFDQEGDIELVSPVFQSRGSIKIGDVFFVLFLGSRIGAAVERR